MTDITYTGKDREVLRRLGWETAKIASDPRNAENARGWELLNDKKSFRPMVWINEVPWHEMNVNDELTLQCETDWARALEDQMRKTIYQWNHFPGHMVVSPYLECPLAIHSTGFGITEDADAVATDEKNDVVSRHFHIQISEPEDIEKIRMPVITHDKEKTEQRYFAMCEIFSGILPVQKTGIKHIWYTPWDYLVRWWGVEEAIMDLILRPDMVHCAYERMVQAWMTEMDQLEDQELLSLDNNNTRIGSGGYGYTSQLPGNDYDPAHIRARNLWGCSNAQIFSTVSPQMHWDFAIEHDLKWLKRFGLTYYGCCEPLDLKVGFLRRIPNLRKISASPWCDSKRIIEEIGDSYVISRKPNPAIVATDTFNAEQAEKELREFMDLTGGNCHVELIFKDISTVRYDPVRLWEWEKIAMRVAEDYSG